MKQGLKNVERKFAKQREEIWEKPGTIKNMIEQEFSKKELKELLPVRQEFEGFIGHLI